MTSEEIQVYLTGAKRRIQQSIDRLLSIPDDQKNSETMLRPWNRLSNEIVIDFGVLTFLARSDLPCSLEAGSAIQNLLTFILQSLIQNSDLYYSLMSYVNKSLGDSRALSSYEHHEIHCLLESCEQMKQSLSDEEQRTLDQLKALNSKHERTPFVHLKSQTPDKTRANKQQAKELTVLTLNTCFVPGDFPALFGGVHLPWEKRISPVAEKILASRADIVCLQEVHAEDASYALYEALKHDYTYFYAAIGPRPLGFSLQTLGFPSGLFVASKYPIENPEFTLFSVVGFPMNYGFFDFVVKDGKKPIAHIYTTHLQSLDFDQFDQIRAAQMTQILEKMKSDIAKQGSKMPYFLCGDLNIPYGSQEPGLALIKTHFLDDYNKHQKPVCSGNRTCTDYFTNYFFSSSKKPDEIDPNFQILDYALLLRSLPDLPNQPLCQEYGIQTVQIEMNNLDQPELAASDHHALLTIIRPL